MIVGSPTGLFCDFTIARMASLIVFGVFDEEGDLGVFDDASGDGARADATDFATRFADDFAGDDFLAIVVFGFDAAALGARFVAVEEEAIFASSSSAVFFGGVRRARPLIVITSLFALRVLDGLVDHYK